MERRGTLTDAIDVAAPAKVNLFLHVVGRRKDRYHEIESLFVLIDLADRLTLTLRDDGKIVRKAPIDGVSTEQDLAVRAARLLKETSRVEHGVTIRLAKRIPMGAGLGGGSSDAASVLLGLNRLWRIDRPRAELEALAVTLGADVPFFVHGENAFVQGMGERLTPVSLPRRWIALAVPNVNVPTAEIYASPTLTRTTPRAKMSVFSESYGRNDLQAVASSRHEEVAGAAAALASSRTGVRMSGSGASVFALCDDEMTARRAIDALPAGVVRYVARTLAHHPLRAFARS
ncbi:MAG TPA: 4-(cytidine 5'-diphospho)-2-C-methyl-D-erythritol kinase [Casimicrobiaceae bacterium]|nr:4-(cytidine 5'-diphospho)-2-C-methyl-D-erythritol kinase [Casimicrobiaceae bacterium]